MCACKATWEMEGQSTCVRGASREGQSRRGRSPGRQRDRIKEYMCEVLVEGGGSSKEGVFGQWRNVGIWTK